MVVESYTYRTLPHSLTHPPKASLASRTAAGDMSVTSRQWPAWRPEGLRFGGAAPLLSSSLSSVSASSSLSALYSSLYSAGGRGADQLRRLVSTERLAERLAHGLAGCQRRAAEVLAEALASPRAAVSKPQPLPSIYPPTHACIHASIHVTRQSTINPSAHQPIVKPRQ